MESNPLRTGLDIGSANSFLRVLDNKMIFINFLQISKTIRHFKSYFLGLFFLLATTVIRKLIAYKTYEEEKKLIWVQQHK